MLRLMTLLSLCLLLIRCAATEPNAAITEEPPTLTSAPPTATIPPTPFATTSAERLPIYRTDFPFDFVVERYTYTVTTGDVQHVQTVKIEHNNLQPAMRYTIDGIDDTVMQVTFVDGVVDTVGVYGVCETVLPDTFNFASLLNYHWLRSFNILEFYQAGDPFSGSTNNLPTERYTFAQRALVDADDQLDSITGTIETLHFNSEEWITMHASIDALATGNPATGEVGESRIAYRYDLTILGDGFGIERPVNCTQPNVAATQEP